MKQTEISVIIPCFNQEKHLKQCLDSIFSQHYEKFEIVAVDDGSTDETPAILKEYAEKDERIKILTGRNLGAGAARNYGLREAVGKYVLFMDSDDFLEQGALEILSAVISERSADIYFFNFKTYNDKNGEYDNKIMFDGLPGRISYQGGSVGFSEVRFEDKKEFFLWSYVAPWNKLYSREFITENRLSFDEIFSTNDRTFYFSSLIKSNTIVTLDKILINYRINNASSLTGSYNSFKFENRKYAYKSSVQWIDEEDRLLRETFFKVTVLDFVTFFQKTENEERYDIFVKTMRFFKEMDTANTATCINESDRIGFYFKLFCESEYLEGIEQDRIIPVVMASNDKYLPYLSVTLRSLIDNSCDDYFYDVYILHTGIGELNKIKICNMGQRNIHVRELDVSCLVKSLPLYSKGHFSVEMYYRILIPELLWHYKKVLYVDCDTVLNADAAEFLSLDIGKAIIGAVRNPLDRDMYKYVTRELGLDADEYFNSGMLIIDTLLFKKHDVKNRCFEILSDYRKLACPDQDVLNLSCRGMCSYLDEEWNFQAGNHSYTLEYKYSVLDNIKLIHFTTGKKPWNTEGLALGELFWKSARQTPYYEDITLVYLHSTIKKETVTKSLAAPQRSRILINEMNMRHYEVINPDGEDKKTIISWPFRMTAKFFAHWRMYGFRSAIRKIPDKLRYVGKRIFKERHI